MKNILHFILSIIAVNASAQYVEDWVRTADHYSKAGTWLTRDANDNAFVTSHDGSIWLRKYDIDGNELWEVHDSTDVQFNYQYPSQVHVDPQGNALVVGYRYTLSSDGHNANAIIVLKYNSDGDFIYKKIYDGTYSFFNNSQYWTKVTSQMDAEGYLYIGTAGNVDGYPETGFNAIKVNHDGEIVWVSTKDFSSNFYFVNNIRLKGNKLGLTGATNYSSANASTWVLDTTGTDSWSYVSQGVGGKDVAFDNTGNTFMLTWISTDFLGDVAVFKFNSSGDSIWRELYDFGHSELSSRMELTPDNNLAIMAYGNQQPDNWYSDWITLKVDLDGNLLWSKRYDQHDDNDELPYMMTVDELSNVYVTGIGGPWPGGSNLGERQMPIIKYNAAGDSVWSVAIDTFTEYNTGVGLILDSQNGLYALGGDFSILIHYKDTSSISVDVNENIFEENSVSVFPNPANDVINISSAGEIKTIEVFDVVGRTVYVNRFVNAKQITVDVKSWIDGFYLIRLSESNGQTTWWKFQKE